MRIGPAGTTDLTSAAYGADRAGGFVSRIARAPSNTGTIWAVDEHGPPVHLGQRERSRVRRSSGRGSTPSAANDPERFISGIYVDPTNPNRAWVSYSGYNFNTPAQPGHVFRVDRAGNTATWTNLDGGLGPLGDLPVTDLVSDADTGDLYAATDFGVLKLAPAATSWTLAAPGMPMVEVAGLTIVPSERILYAATHGRSIWSLKLP